MLGRYSSDKRLYIKRSIGGRGLKSVREMFEETGLCVFT